MPTCSRCGAQVPAGARHCPGCGALQSSVSQLPTELGGGGAAAPGSRPPSHVTIGRLDSSASFGSATFQPGQVLEGRYRIVGLLGRGGMGEVYRADDLQLSQAVALKFLGPAFAGRPDMLERFRGEVRIARQVAHPNVCRVYDIGEVDGQVFLSMEYVDGEDLGTLLRRIGRLPRDKADQVARQLCAGVAAAHDRGVIHRDLKPSNVMLDGEGRVRVTDFGLAVQGGAGAGERVGTPAYMAPEQFEGHTPTAQTDLYSVGLILYEMYTGRRPLDATTWEGWKGQHSQVEPRTPDEVERDVDATVARAILRCLEKDPAKRPRTALQLAGSLPGGDPLAAALAAGETPTPAMVAASGGAGATAMRTGALLLGGFLVLLAGYLAIAPAAMDLGLTPLTRGHDALLARAHDVVEQLGYEAHPRDEATWFERDYNPLLWRARHEPSTHWRHDYARTGVPLQFHYRGSNAPLRPRGGSRVTGEDPPPIAEGMVSLRLNAEGQLRGFLGVAPMADSGGAATAAPDVAGLFALAGLDTARFTEVAARRRPFVAFDLQHTWRGERAAWPGVPLTVTAAWWRGKLVWFGVRGPWDDPNALAGTRRSNPIANVVRALMVAALIALGFVSFGARLRSGKSDWFGGLRLVNALMLLSFGNWLFTAHHTLVPDAEFASLMQTLGAGLMGAGVAFFIYVGVEPEVRRRVPELLIGWARLLQGRWRDARVGRDVLMGSVGGAASAFVLALVNAIPAWVPFRGQTPVPPNTDVLTGGRFLFGQFTAIPLNTLGVSFGLFGVWFMLWLAFRRRLPAAIGLGVVMTLLALGAENPVLEVPGALVDGVLMAWLLSRHGLLPLFVAWSVRLMFTGIPAPFSTTSPWAFSAFIAIAVPLLLVLEAFRVSTRGNRVPTGE